MAVQKKNNTVSLMAWVKEVFFIKRMSSVPGLIVMALIGIGLAYAGSAVNEKLPLVIAVGAIGIFFVLVCLYYPELAYYSYVYSIIIFTLPARLFGIPLPLGPLLEPTGYLAVISILAAQYRKRQNSADFWKTPISLMLVLLFCFYLMEAFNPEINNWQGWFKFFRKEIIYLLFYYVSFLMLDSMEKIRRFVKLWLILATGVALWGIKQQWFGFTPYEDAWIHSDSNITTLLFQGGMFRKFSLLPDPASFGVMMASTALFTLVLAIRTPIKRNKKILYCITFLEMVASSYSGTRTCNVMLIAGLLSYIIFTLNEKRTMIVLISSVAISVFLLFGPLQNSPVIFRIKTTFDGSKEPSNMVRDVNRHNIQPYIHEHPIGGGLNTCGEEGAAYYPGHPLAGYPPDSGYMKIMLEQGWVGLAINLILYFLILYRGITGFYDSRKGEIKTLYIAFTVCIFSLVVGQYSQLAISQYPQYLFYLATLVIFYKLKEYDTKNPEDYTLAEA
ncbi:MAG: O-antigen ligase family protein [Bacteroidota bacterium]